MRRGRALRVMLCAFLPLSTEKSLPADRGPGGGAKQRVRGPRKEQTTEFVARPSPGALTRSDPRIVVRGQALFPRER